MKLLLCFKCGEIRSLHHVRTECGCRMTWGRYVDDVQAEYGGEGCLLGMTNSSLLKAATRFKASGSGQPITAFSIGTDSASIRKVR